MLDIFLNSYKMFLILLFANAIINFIFDFKVFGGLLIFPKIRTFLKQL